ncbi:MAG: hypothetical protein M1834_008380 [Cirrosporium novae-zelandiae]|nr:MAG: hypothetical protein M1834_008380 [Cirrosporium novae-zelandiae]
MPGRRPRKVLSREEQVSHLLSRILRHQAVNLGLKLNPKGYAEVDKVLALQNIRSLKVTFPELRKIVAENDKQRYSLIPRDESISPESEQASDYLIRANQGHSIKLESVDLLTPITAEAGNIPETVVHGTDKATWDAIIRSGGLSKMTRNHVHLATGPSLGAVESGAAFARKSGIVKGGVDDSSTNVNFPVSGIRKSTSLFIYIDIRRALESGVNFWMSDNGVVLTEGNDKGLLLTEFFNVVFAKKQGVIWEGGKQVAELYGKSGE